MADPRCAQEAALADGTGEVQEHSSASEECTSRHLASWSNFCEREIDTMHSGLLQWEGGRSEGMSEICSNCEIFNTGRSMELISANLTLFLLKYTNTF